MAGMEVTKVVVSRPKARELYREYKKHVHYQEPMDAEIQRAYQLISQGRVVIQAIESIKRAGLDDDAMPKLAIARADQTKCHLELWGDGSARFEPDRWGRGGRTMTFNMPADFFPRRPAGARGAGDAMVPIVPIHLRPKRGLANYSILWEAVWQRVPPRDPYLLRRIGRADLWLVVAAWDLTEVERAVMAGRVSS